jgi:hypothetical protein
MWRSHLFRTPSITVTMSWAAAMVGVAATVVFLLIGLVHIDDNYHVDHVAGAWMGLVAYARQGVLYPPLYEDGFFGGTRYGPTGITLNAFAAGATGELLVSGKALALLVMSAVLALVYRIARDLGCGKAVAVAVLGAVISTFAAEFAGTSIYGDALAVALQLAGLAVILRRDDRKGAVVAGILVALAVTAKISALWGGAAVLIWLIMHRRNSILAFVLTSATTLFGLFGLMALVSQGRMVENLVGLSGSAFSGISDLLVATPLKAADLLVHHAVATALLLPLAALALGVAIYQRDVQIVDLAFVCASILTLVTLTDVGTDFNHLLDLAALVPLVVAGMLCRTRATVLHAVLLTVLCTASAVSLLGLRHDFKQAVLIAVSGDTPQNLVAPALDGQIAEPFLSEDPSIAVERGQRPEVLDSFMLLRILRDRPDLEQRLVERLNHREFANIVLIMDLDLHDPWWSESHLGLGVARAIDRNYVMTDKVQGPVFRYRLLKPR